MNPDVVAADVQDDIPHSAEGIDGQMDNQTQPSASTSSVQIPVLVYHHTYDYGQLPTPPPDQSPTVQSPSMANDDASSLTSPQRRHKVGIEVVQDEDHVRSQSFSTDSAELDLQIDTKPVGEPGYTVVEPEPDGEHADDDADGEIDFDFEVVSMSDASHIRDEAGKDGEIELPLDYSVEEPLTDGRLTEVGFFWRCLVSIYVDFLQEPGDRVLSLGVVSIEAEESQAHHVHCKTSMQDVPFSADEDPVPLDSEVNLQVEMNIQLQTTSNPALEQPTANSELHVIPDAISSAMPITAGANVVDPSCPDTPSHLSANFIPVALDAKPQAHGQAQGTDLFDPADKSASVTPLENIHRQVLDELAHTFFRTPAVSPTSTPVEELVPVANIDLVIDRAVGHVRVAQPAQLPPIGREGTNIFDAHTASNIHATNSRDSPISIPTFPPPRDTPVPTHVTLTRKPTDPILVSDPYPYSLSTPGVSLMDPTEEDTEQDNSISSNSTWEKDLEDKDTNSILDDADELELQYPPEPDILAKLNVPATIESEEASKVVDEGADGHVDPESMVTHLTESSVEIQPVADPSTLTSMRNLASTECHQGRLSEAELITSDSTVARGTSNGVEKNDISQREISPM